MKKIKCAKVRVLFEYDYTDSANELIEQGIVDNLRGLKSILQEDGMEDTIADLTEGGTYDNIEVTILP